MWVQKLWLAGPAHPSLVSLFLLQNSGSFHVDSLLGVPQEVILPASTGRENQAPPFCLLLSNLTFKNVSSQKKHDRILGRLLPGREMPYLSLQGK